MRTAETVLNIIHDRGTRGLPLEDVYRQLFNPDLYLRAYGRISRNQGALTKGITEETADGMSLRKIESLITAIRAERFQWTPVRRIHIEKNNGSGKKRPLGIPTWSDKLVQEVVRSILEAYYEPQFSDHSHGFRPNRGCQTALTTIRKTWTGTKWFIEGDLKGCFDHIDHQVLLSIIREKIHDHRFLRLIENLLQAGYCEVWNYRPTLSGTPQGGIASPILANIYLDQLDRSVAEQLIPAYTRGERRQLNEEYNRINALYHYYLRKQDYQRAKEYKERSSSLPSVVPDDPDYRRLRYLRYADDFLLGLIGTRQEAEEITERLDRFTREKLKMELSKEKTLLTHATTQAARFLGYEIRTQTSDQRRLINGDIVLLVPAEVVEARCTRYMRQGKPIHRPELLQHSDYENIVLYQAEYKGYVQYYTLAQNLSWLNKLRWIMETSLLKTLANKHRTSVMKISQSLKSTRLTAHGPRRCLKLTVEREGKKPLVAYFGGITLKYNKEAVIEDRPLNLYRAPRTQLETRLLADLCEVCGSEKEVEVHHIRKLKDLKVKGRKEKPLWQQIMSARQRKTLVLCHRCHVDLHAGRPLNGQRD